LIFITHNLGIVAELCEYVIVMYAGKIVERAPVMDVFDSPAHPYTKALLDAAFGLQDLRKRKPIPGEPPNLAQLPAGCSFHPRCEYADDHCRKEEPPEVALGPARSAKCWYPVKG
jgi:oligopeptide/dipeptide ABC transporter ATP-binding protein